VFEGLNCLLETAGAIVASSCGQSMLSMPQTKVQHNLDTKTQGSATHMQHLLYTHTSPAAVA